MAPVCSNCGANDFVWANELKTGSLGSGTLSLRARGELALGTRICRSCGHADLFLKDPSVLKAPHTWKPGEFVPIHPRPNPPPAHVQHPSAAPAHPAPVAPPPAAPKPPTSPLPIAAAPLAPPPPPPPPTPPPTASQVAASITTPPGAPQSNDEVKRTARRRASKPRNPPPESPSA